MKTQSKRKRLWQSAVLALLLSCLSALAACAPRPPEPGATAPFSSGKDLAMDSAELNPSHTVKPPPAPAPSDAPVPSQTPDPLGVPTLRLALTAESSALPFLLLHAKGWDLQAGFKLEFCLYDCEEDLNQALPNEKNLAFALMRNWAYLPLANEKAELLAEVQDCSRASILLVREHDPLCQSGPQNPSYPDLPGDPELLKGKTVAYETGSAAQLLLERWLELIAADRTHIKLENLAEDELLRGQAEGELAAIALDIKETTDRRALQTLLSFREIKQPQYACLLAVNNFANERPEACLALICLLYRANQEIEEHPQESAERLLAWYQQQGQTRKLIPLKAELAERPFLQASSLLQDELGASLKERVGFYVERHLMQLTQYAGMEKSIRKDLLREALRRMDLR